MSFVPMSVHFFYDQINTSALCAFDVLPILFV